MGLYRTLKSSLTCHRCSLDFVGEVQFKTGNDGGLPVYEVGEAVELPPNTKYAGLADAYCPNCHGKWRIAEKLVNFEELAKAVSEDRAKAMHDGRPLSSEDVLRLRKQNYSYPGFPNFIARLMDLSIQVHWEEWSDHFQSVSERLIEQGWVAESCDSIEVSVRVAGNGQLVLGELE